MFMINEYKNLPFFQYATKKRIQTRKSTEKPEHWLDHAKAKYSNQLIEDTKILLKVLVLYLPLPIYWALFDQQVRSEMFDISIY